MTKNEVICLKLQQDKTKTKKCARPSEIYIQIHECYRKQIKCYRTLSRQKPLIATNSSNTQLLFVYAIKITLLTFFSDMGPI